MRRQTKVPESRRLARAGQGLRKNPTGPTTLAERRGARSSYGGSPWPRVLPFPGPPQASHCKVTLTFEAGRSGLSPSPRQLPPTLPAPAPAVIFGTWAFWPLPRTASTPTTPLLLFKAYHSTFRNFSEEVFVTAPLGFGHWSIPSTRNLPDGAEARATLEEQKFHWWKKTVEQEEQF